MSVLVWADTCFGSLQTTVPESLVTAASVHHNRGSRLAPRDHLLTEDFGPLDFLGPKILLQTSRAIARVRQPLANVPALTACQIQDASFCGPDGEDPAGKSLNKHPMCIFKGGVFFQRPPCVFLKTSVG